MKYTKYLGIALLLCGSLVRAGDISSLIADHKTLSERLNTLTNTLKEVSKLY